MKLKLDNIKNSLESVDEDLIEMISKIEEISQLKEKTEQQRFFHYNRMEVILDELNRGYFQNTKLSKELNTVEGRKAYFSYKAGPIIEDFISNLLPAGVVAYHVDSYDYDSTVHKKPNQLGRFQGFFYYPGSNTLADAPLEVLNKAGRYQSSGIKMYTIWFETI